MLAKTGFSFFAPFGNRFYSTVEAALERGVLVEVILLSESSHIDASQKQKLLISINGINKLSKKYSDNLKVKLLEQSPVCTLFMVDNEYCFFEPYIPLSEDRREAKLLDTFEILIDSKSSPYASFNTYFKECWSISKPL